MTDSASEQLLSQLNDAIAMVPRGPLRDAPTHPFLAVVGLPRSGTTVFTQVLARTERIEPISNFVALFWGNPALGFVARRMLNAAESEGDLISDYGRTVGIDAPHEAGRMWKRMLRYDSMEDAGPAHAATIDWQLVAHELADITRAAGSAVVSKAFHLGYHLGDALANIPQLRVIRVRRRPEQVVRSLVEAAHRYDGSDGGWVGLRPRGHSLLDDLPTDVRVGLQVLLVDSIIDAEVDRARRSGGHDRILEIDFDDLVDRTDHVASSVATLMGAPDLVLDTRGLKPSGAASNEDEIAELLACLVDHEMFHALRNRDGGIGASV